MSTPHLQRIVSVASTDQKTQQGGLREALRALQSRDSRDFAATLDERKRREREWANFSRDKRLVNSSGETKEKRRANAKWYSTTQLSLEYRDAWLAERVPGKVFLDYACGAGLETLKAARMGAALAMGLDVTYPLPTPAKLPTQQVLGIGAFSSKGTAKPPDCRTIPWTSFCAVICCIISTLTTLIPSCIEF
jgi:hypothetical protein